MYKCFPQQMTSSGVKRETDNQRRRKQRRGQTTKEEGSKEGDREEGADVKQTNVFVYNVHSGWRLQAGSKEQQTSHSQSS